MLIRTISYKTKLVTLTHLKIMLIHYKTICAVFTLDTNQAKNRKTVPVNKERTRVTIFSNPNHNPSCTCTCMHLCTHHRRFHHDGGQLFQGLAHLLSVPFNTMDSTSTDEKLCFVSQNPPRYLSVGTSVDFQLQTHSLPVFFLIKQGTNLFVDNK